MKILLLDIDHTTFYESTPRPYLREFLERVTQQYEVYFYTAAGGQRVRQACQILSYDLKLSRKIVGPMNCFSLTYQNCSTIIHKTDSGAFIEVKCLRKAAAILEVDVSDIILIDDAPIYDNPDREFRIQAPGFSGEVDDNYLLTLLL